MSLLRRAPLSRLIVLALAALAVGASVAVATNLADNSRPKPEPLAVAIHQALSAPPVAGVSAQITLTNNLVSGAGLAQSAPLLKGAEGRMWVSDRGQVRLELQSDAGDSEILYDGASLSYYYGTTHTMYKLALPQSGTGTHEPPAADPQKKMSGLPDVAQIQSALSRVMAQATLSGAQPTNVAGHPAYRVLIKPRSDGGLVGGAALAWDALNGIPLRLDIFASNQRAPVFTLVARKVKYGPVPASTFVAPHAAHTQLIPLPAAPSGSGGASGHTHSPPTPLTPQALAKLPFTVSAPLSAAGLSRTDEQLVTVAGQPAVLLAYGQGLGAIRVLEQKATAQTPPAAAPKQSGGDGGQSTTLPKANINGSAATVLPTALGSLVHYQRQGVAVTLFGAVTATRAEALARAL